MCIWESGKNEMTRNAERDVYWSLAIETQFYLIYPLILLGIYKLAKSRGEGRVKRGLLFAGVTLLLALISVILMIVLFDPQKDASRVYYGTDTRAFSLLFGALLAIMWEYRMVPRRLSASVNMVLGSVSFAALLVMTIAINGLVLCQDLVQVKMRNFSPF